MRGRGTGPAWTAWIDAAYRPLHAAGLSDTDAAAALGVSRTAAANARRRLGLPQTAGPFAASAAAKRAGHAAKIGHGNAGRRAFAAADYGLPAALYAAQVRIVVALAAGPTTRAGIAARAGLTAKSVGACGIGGRVHWLRDLRDRGLVASSGRRGRHQSIYFLTPAALAALATPETEFPGAPEN